MICLGPVARPEAPYQFMFRLALLIGVVTAALLPPTVVRAHPHGWIDIQVTVLVDQSGAILGLRESWLFDEIYSAFATEGFDGDGDGAPDPERLQELAAVNLHQLREYDYFTEVSTASGALAIPDAVDASTAFGSGRLYIAFTLLFEEPIPRADQPVRYAIFDPYYLAAMSHLADGDGIRLEGGPPGCTVSMAEADPDPALIAYAFSLDITQAIDNSLGAQFAERVTVSCVDAL
jgi:ABC-type uncharacterized transport system substrate-binding protein